jgi:hypothetical protein
LVTFLLNEAIAIGIGMTHLHVLLAMGTTSSIMREQHRTSRPTARRHTDFVVSRQVM